MEIKIFNNDAKWLRTLLIACAIFGILSCASLVFWGEIPEMVLCSASLAAFAIATKRYGSKALEDDDVLAFVSNLLANWSEHADTIKIVNDSLDDSFGFSASVRAALLEYRRTGAIEPSFSKVRSRNQELAAILDAISLRLDSGIDTKAELQAIALELQSAHDRKLRGIGISSNAAAISNAGSTLFFPAFAGISLGIIKATSISGQQAGLAASLATIFIGYMAITTATGARYFRGSLPVKAARICSLCSLSFLILRICSTLQIGAV